MEIAELKLEKLIPYINNPRKKQEVDKVADSIKEFGWQQPIVIDENNVIVVGHTRYYAAKKLKLTTVPVHTAKGLSESQIKAYRIADNKLNNALWDNDLLKVEIKALREDEFNIDLTGFDVKDLQDIFSEKLEEEFKEIEENFKTQHTCPACGFQYD